MKIIKFTLNNVDIKLGKKEKFYIRASGSGKVLFRLKNPQKETFSLIINLFIKT